MSRQAFQDGLSSFKTGNYQKAIEHFDKAVVGGSQNLYLIYDTRAAAYLKLGQRKDALKDAKATIDVAPERWQGYARAARVFLQSNKFDAAQTMVTMALARLKEAEKDRRTSLLELKSEVQKLKEKHRLKTLDNMAKLPVELFADIARALVDEDHTVLITLLHVSRGWRNVIESIPLLWTKLILTQRRPKPKAKLWIERSTGRLVELKVTEACVNSLRWPGDSLNGVCWEKLQICRAQHWDVLGYLHSINKAHTVTSFRVVDFDYDRRDISFTTATQIRLLDYTDASFDLQSLTISAGILDLERLMKQVNGLTTCVLRSCFLQSGAWGPFLASNPLLECLTLENVYPFTQKAAEASTLELENLKTLRLACNVPQDIFTANMAQLQLLNIRGCWRDETNFLIRHLVDSMVALTELRINACQLDDVVPFISVLRNSPDLETLEVSNLAAGVTSIMESLSAHYQPPLSTLHPILRDDPRPPPQDPICPQLKYLDFSGCPEVQTGPLVRLIKSRLPAQSSNLSTDIPGSTSSLPDASTIDPPPTARIETLVIDRCPNVDGEWLPRIRSAVPVVSCVYMTKKTKYRGA